MTVASETSKVKYNGNDSTTIFAYTYKITDEEQLQVIIADSDDLVPDNSYTLILNTDYTVSDVGEASGGNVTLGDLTTYCDQATLPTGWVISIARVVQVVQETDFENQGGFFADTHEDAFDYQTFINQQQKEELDRCVKVGITSDTDPDDLLDEIETSKDAAAASAVAAAASEAAAAASAAAAATSETNAATSETNAAASESAASTSETNAAASEAAAAASESAAATSETNAAASEAAAATSETNAATSETNAATSETNAGTSETNAAASAAAAAASAASIDQAFTKLKGRRATGAGALAAFKLIKANGDYPTDTVPTIDVVSSFDDSPIGFTFEAFTDGETDLFLEKGRVVITGFDCSLASIGDKVYADASGDPTLTETDFQIGYVLDNAANGIVYIDLGAGGSGSGLIDGTDKRLGVETIDGSTNAVDTDIDVYSPSSGYAYGLKLIIANFNTSEVAKVRVANRDGAIADDDYLVYDISIGPESEPIVIELPGMTSSETITVRSDVVDVNFALFGEEASSDKKAYCLGRHEISSVDTDEDVVSFTEENQVDIIVCNRDASETASVILKLADTASEADEDIIYMGQILPNQSKAIALDLNVANSYKVVAQSDIGDVNVQVYSRAKTQFGTGMLLPAEVLLKAARDHQIDYLSTPYTVTASFASIGVSVTAQKTGYYKLNAPLNTYFAAQNDDCYLYFAINGSRIVGTQRRESVNSAASNNFRTTTLHKDHVFLEEGDVVTIEAKYLGGAGCQIYYTSSSGNEQEGFLEITQEENLVDYVKNPHQTDYYTKTDRAVTGSGWTTNEVLFTDYKDASGQWWSEFWISGTYSGTGITLAIANFVAKNITGEQYPLAIKHNSSFADGQAYMDANTGNLSFSTNASRTSWRFSGRVPLESKPSDI